MALATLATLVLLAGCGSDDETTESDTTTTAPAADPSDQPADDGDEIAADAAGDGEAPDDDETTDSAGADATDEDATTADEDGAADTTGAEELFPDVVGASASLAADGSWTFQATLSSPYDTPERYADAWRVVGPDDEVYGIRELAHDHANEQPFTRSQSGIVIPDGVDVVTVEGRDQVSGWGGATVEVELER